MIRVRFFVLFSLSAYKSISFRFVACTLGLVRRFYIILLKFLFSSFNTKFYKYLPSIKK